MVAARPCFIGLSSSTHANITSAAGDVDRHRIVVHCANLLILSISCCMLWVRVSLYSVSSGTRIKECPSLHVVFHTSFLHSDTSACYSLLSFAERWHELSGMSQYLYQCLILARPSSDGRCSPSCRSISSSNRQGKATSRRGIQTRVVIPGAHIVYSHSFIE